MSSLEKQETPYFTESEGVEKLGVKVKISWKIRGRIVNSKGTVTNMFRVTDTGFSILIKCVTTEGEMISQLFNKSRYENWVVEIPSSAIGDHYSRRDTPLGKLLSQWPFIK